MPNIQHSVLSTGELHEPKGAAAASAGDIYVADGAGSGEWKRLVSYSCLRASSSGNTTGITTSFQAVNDANLGGTIAWATNIKSADITHGTTDGYFQVSEAGVYKLDTVVNFIAATADTFTWTIGIDSGGGIVAQDTYMQSAVNTTSTTETRSLSVTCVASLSASDKVYLMVKSAAGNELALSFVNFTSERVG